MINVPTYMHGPEIKRTPQLVTSVPAVVTKSFRDFLCRKYAHVLLFNSFVSKQSQLDSFCNVVGCEHTHPMVCGL